MSHTPANSNLDYIRALYAAQDTLLTRIDAALHACKLPMHIGAEEGKLLQMFIRLYGVKNILEIGTLAGYSTLWMARGLPSDGHITTINKDAPHIEMARGFFAESDVADKITMLEGDARHILSTLTGRQFDMIFIDADKINYTTYLNWAEKLVRKNGLIIADNTLLFGAVTKDAPPEGISPTAFNTMREFNQRLADQTRYFSTMIPTMQGMTIAIKLF